MEVWNALWISAPASGNNNNKKKKKSVTYRKTYATKITKCVHLVSFIIADSL